jgi:hypothetical protein
MKEEKEQEHHFELRSEKVRSIVGQVPSYLIRYGISAIGGTLLSLLVVAYFLPYKQVYSGTATVYGIPSLSTDSIDITILLKFENKRPSNAFGQTLRLQSPNRTIEGQILRLSSVRDTLERQNALCRFSTISIKPIENQTVDFQIVQSSNNLFHKLLGDVEL